MNQPEKIIVPAGKVAWCVCNMSNKLPFCDGSHKDTDKVPFVETFEKDTQIYADACARAISHFAMVHM